MAQLIKVSDPTAHLRGPEQGYYEALDNAHDLIQSLNSEGCLSYVNQRWLETLGYRAAEAPGLSFEEIIQPEQIGVWRDIFQQLKRGQCFVNQRLVLMTKSGQQLVTAGNFKPSFEEGRFIACWGSLQDITEPEGKEEELRQAYQQTQQYAAELVEKIKEERRQREIATILAEVVASVSLTLSTDELLDHILLKLQQLIAYDSASIFLIKGDFLVLEAGRGFEVNVIGQQLPLEQNLLFQDMRVHKSYILLHDTPPDTRYQRWSGAEKVRGWIGAPLTVAQEVIGYLAVDRHTPDTFSPAEAELVQAFAHQVAGTIYNAHLFTDLKHVQAQLIQRERLAALGQMAATVAHELRNPLTTIRTGVEYFLRDVAETDPRWRGAALMQANMGRIDHILEDLLHVACTPEPTLTPGLLQPVIEGEVARWQMLLTEKKITCNIQCAANLPSLLLDPEQMARVLSNLIGNSADSLQPEGEIEITLHLQGQNQVMTFADNGPGISAEHLARIFEPFFTTKSRGTGLGLYLVKQIIEFHGGNINVWSKVGLGAKFVITLPSPTRN